MTYSQLTQLSRPALLQAQQDAIMTQDHATLKRIANIMTGFSNLIKEEPKEQPQIWMKREVEDVNEEAFFSGDDDWYTRYV